MIAKVLQCAIVVKVTDALTRKPQSAVTGTRHKQPRSTRRAFWSVLRSPSGELDGGLADVFPVQRSVLFDGWAICHEAPGRGNRLVPNVVHIVLKHEPKAVPRLRFQAVLPHISRRSEGRFAMKINTGVNALCRQIELAVATPRDSRHLRVDNALN